MFRCRIVEPLHPAGNMEVLLNLRQVVFLFPHWEETDKCVVRMTGEANAFIILASFDDVRHEIERMNHDA